MEKRKKVTLCLLLVTILVVLAGCGTTSTQTNEITQTGSDSPATVQAKTTDAVYLKLLLAVWELPPENDPVKAAIEKATNTKIEIVLPPMTEYTQKMMTMVASGDYPDMMNVLDSTNWRLFADQGVIIPIDDLLPTYGSVLLKEIPENSWALYRTDGKQWGVPRINVRAYSSLFARNDWIKELGFGDDWADTIGKEKSKTLDEFYQLLKAMKEKKGATFTGTSLKTSLSPFYGAFGTSAVSDFYLMSNGNFVRAMQDSRMRDALIWLNKLYAEGIIDPEIITNKQEQVNNKCVNNEAGIAWDLWNLPYRLDNDMKLNETNPTAEWVYINPPTGSDGQAYMEAESKLWDGVMVVSSKSKAPEKCIEILNYLRGDGYEVSTYGIEGDFYTWKGEGENKQRIVTDLGKSGWIHTYSLMREFWDPYWFYPAYGNYAEPLEDASVENLLLPNIADCPPIGQVYKQYGTDLLEFEEEMLTKFIIGEESLDKWDAYVEKCKTIYHVDEINTEIYNNLKNDKRIN